MKSDKQVDVRALDTTTGQWSVGSGATVSDALENCKPDLAAKSKRRRKRTPLPNDGDGRSPAVSSRPTSRR